MDSSLWWNIARVTKTRRVDGPGTNKIVMENILQWVTSVVDRKSGRSLEIDFYEGYVIYMVDEVDRGIKNLEVTYAIWYETVPADFEAYFLEYCKILYQKSLILDPNKVVQNKKIDDLSVTYFSPTELVAKWEASLSAPHMQKILKKYRNFWIA